MVFPKLHIKFFQVVFNSFHFYGILGFLLGFSLGISLCYLLDLSLSILLIITIIGAATFFLLAFSAKIITGQEYIVYYHHEIAILLACFLTLKLLNQPVLIYLDITILGIATFLAFGRIGCFSVGCCHGIPSKDGVKYGHEHVKAGFTPHYENVSLLPVQLIESAFVFLITIIGTFLLLKQAPPGTVLIIYTVIYGVFRFTMEFFRGDPERPYWKGFSEAQWTTLVLFILSTILSWMGWLPFYVWHLWLVGSLIVFMIGITIYRKQQKNPTYQIKNPHHIAEIANGLKSVQEVQKRLKKQSNQPLIPMFHTSLGLKISMGNIYSRGNQFTHYTLSSTNADQTSAFKINLKVVNVIGKIIQTIHHRNEQFYVQAGQANIYHIIFSIPQLAPHPQPQPPH